MRLQLLKLLCKINFIPTVTWYSWRCDDEVLWWVVCSELFVPTLNLHEARRKMRVWRKLKLSFSFLYCVVPCLKCYITFLFKTFHLFLGYVAPRIFFAPGLPLMWSLKLEMRVVWCERDLPVSMWVVIVSTRVCSHIICWRDEFWPSIWSATWSSRNTCWRKSLLYIVPSVLHLIYM